MNSGELAGILAVVGTIIGGLVTYFTWHGNANAKTHEGRVNDLQEAMEELRKDFKWQREDLTRQISDLKVQIVNYENSARRQAHMLEDYARHVAKLERIMAANDMKIPEFETTPFIGGMS